MRDRCFRVAAGLVTLLALAWVAGPARGAAAAAPSSPRPVGAGVLTLRMNEALTWPQQFTAQVTVEPYRSSTARLGAPEGTGSSQGAPAETVRLKLSGIVPDAFSWEPASTAQQVTGGAAWQGWVQIDRSGPGPRFAYGYEGFPFLEVLRVYLAVFRPMPEGARLVLLDNVDVLGRPAVRATLESPLAAEKVDVVLDTTTGLPLQIGAPARGGEAGRVMFKAVRADLPEKGAAAIEYEAPLFGREGRLKIGRSASGRWFVREAVMGEGSGARQIRFEQLKLDAEAGAVQPPETSLLKQLRKWTDEAKQAYDKRDWATAVQRYTAVVGVDPYNLSAHNYLGNAAMEMGDWVTAAGAFDQLIQLAPESPIGYNNLAYLYAEFGTRPRHALDLARKAMDLSGDEPSVSILDTYGWVLFHNDQLEEAVRVLERAVVASGDDPASQAEVLYHLGVVKWRLGRLDEARRLLNQALSMNPALEKARQALGSLPEES